jgi:predicted site-specific integrase-resolvase
MSEKLYASAVVAARLGLKVSTLRMWSRAGLIPAGRSRGGAKWLWNDKQIKEIANMLADGEVAAEVEACPA